MLQLGSFLVCVCVCIYIFLVGDAYNLQYTFYNYSNNSSSSSGHMCQQFAVGRFPVSSMWQTVSRTTFIDLVARAHHQHSCSCGAEH